MVLGEIVLFFQLIPKLKFADEAGEYFIRLFKSLADILGVVNFLKFVFVGVYQKLVLIHVLRHADTGQDHVDQALYAALVKTFFKSRRSFGLILENDF